MAVGIDDYGRPTLRYDSSIEEFETVCQMHTHHTDCGEQDTHVEVFRLASVDSMDRDPLAESNHHTMLESLAAVEKNDPSGIGDDVAQDVWDTVTGAFANHDRIIVVRRRGPDGGFTAAFSEAYRLRMKLFDSCALDESDWSERQDAMFQDEVSEAIACIMEGCSDLGAPLDSPQQLKAISVMFQERAYETLDPHADCGHVSEGAVIGLWSECRDMYYQGLAEQALSDWAQTRRAALAPIPGQDPLPL